MPRFLIERTVPQAGQMNAQQLQDLSHASNDVIADMRRNGIDIQWEHSYVAGDSLHCVYLAPDEKAIREHARIGGFPCDSVTVIGTIITPSNAN